MNKKMRRILLFFCFVVLSFSLSAQSASVQDVWIERNVSLDGGRRYFKIHTSLDIHGLRGRTCSVAAYVFDADGDKVQSNDSWNRAPDGQVCTQTTITPSYTDSHWDNIELLLPNDAIDAYSFNYNYFIAVAVFYSGVQLALYDDFTDYNSFSMDGNSEYAYSPQSYSRPSSSSSYSSGSSSSGSTVGVLAGIAAIGAAIYGISKLFDDDDDSSSSSSGSSSSTSSGYYTKKYSSEGVGRLLASGGLYACRFEDGSNMTRIDVVTDARIITRGGTQYISLPNWIGGEYELKHGYSGTLEGGVIYMYEGGDNWYLMDPQKNIILY